MLSQKVAAVLRGWLPLAVAIVLLAGIVYGSGQQLLRQGANDPQIQMAEDAAAALGSGQALPETGQVDMATSLAPYLIVFDARGNPVSGSARLHGALPKVPLGVLQAARRSGENRVTWQPEAGVRSAAVIVPTGGRQPGYVLAGRSLREVEARESNLLLMVTLGTVFTLGATLFTAVVVHAL